LKVHVYTYSILTAVGLATVPIILSPKWPALGTITKAEDLNLSGIVLDTAVNVMITAMISMRIFSVYRMISKDFNPIQAHAKKYINLVTMLVESAAPCAILGIISIVSFIDIGPAALFFVLWGPAISQIWSASIVSRLFYNTSQKAKTRPSDALSTTHHIPSRRRKRLDERYFTRVDTSNRLTGVCSPHSQHRDLGFRT
jgi:hypothetical protein